jgi:hypothetical protein
MRPQEFIGPDINYYCTCIYSIPNHEIFLSLLYIMKCTIYNSLQTILLFKTVWIKTRFIFNIFTSIQFNPVHNFSKVCLNN